VLSFTAGGFIYIALVNIMPELLAHNSSFTQVLHTHPLHHSPPIPSLPLAPTHPTSTHQPPTNHSTNASFAQVLLEVLAICAGIGLMVLVALYE
jgi:hypothetical protein